MNARALKIGELRNLMIVQQMSSLANETFLGILKHCGPSLRRVFLFFLLSFVLALLPPPRLAPRVLASATEAVRLRTASAPNKAFNEAFPTTTEGKEAARGCCYCVTFPFQNFLISCQLLICSLENWAAVAVAFDSELAKFADERL